MPDGDTYSGRVETGEVCCRRRVAISLCDPHNGMLEYAIQISAYTGASPTFRGLRLTRDPRGGA